MQWFITLINQRPYLDLPRDAGGWILSGLLLLFAVIHVIRKRQVFLSLSTGQRNLLLLVLLSAPFLSLFFGVTITAGTIRQRLVFLVLQALPVLFAAARFGSAAGAVTGMITGAVSAYWGAHSLLPLIEYSLIGLSFGYLNHQNFPTAFYRLLRHPLASALMVIVCLAPLDIILHFFFTTGSLPQRLDAALINVWPFFAVRAVEVMQAGLIVQVFSMTHLISMGAVSEQSETITEISLQKRFLLSALPFFFVLFLVLMIGDWLVAGKAAREMLSGRMASSAEVAAESLPYFLEAGQSLIVSTINPYWAEMSQEQLAQDLDLRLNSVPFFQEFILLDKSGEILSYAPSSAAALTTEELAGSIYALKGLPVQTQTLPPIQGQASSRVAFITGFRDKKGDIAGVFIGRTDLTNNPFTRPAIRALNSLDDLNGSGVILDENLRVLYNPKGADLLQIINWHLPEKSGLFEGQGSDGEKVLYYYYSIPGRPWSVLLSVPAVKAQELALNIAEQIFLLLALMCLIALVLLQVGVGGISRNLIQLSRQTALFAQGELDQPISVGGHGEIGKLAEDFEAMRISLKTRLDELNRLLWVSKTIAQEPDLSKSSRSILEAANFPGVTSARLIFLNTTEAGNQTAAYALGDMAEVYKELDAEILRKVEEDGELIISNFRRVKKIFAAPVSEGPGALAAFPLRYEDAFFGAIWLGYQGSHSFDKNEIGFLNTLAGLAAIAAASAKLFTNSEIGRQRLEAVVNSTPEPVLVIDNNNCLLISNPAALQVPGLLSSARVGQNIEKIVTAPELLELLRSPLTERTATREIPLANGTTYHASVAPVNAEGKQVGRVCILRDITSYKELDTLRTDFVATVSHDLRSPLTLMKGYATMLSLVGDLNEQQKSYVAKIQNGVENMSRLINNLLDLGRIEGGLVLNYEEISPEELVNQVMNNLTPLAEQKKIRFAIEGMDCRNIFVDRALMEQVFFNLVDNAIKFSPLNAIVLVKFSQDENQTTFEIRDNGIGIAPLDLPRLFEKFYRSNRREAYSSRGSGLGLAIVKSIIEQHKGKIWVESQLGKGTSFYFCVPNQP